MPAATFDFTEKYRVEQGAYREQSFIWKPSGVIAVLTGFSARTQFRKSVSSPDVLLSLTIANGGIVITPLEGKITMIFKESDTVGVTWKSGVYDLEIIDPSGKPMRLIEGSFELSKEVTR